MKTLALVPWDISTPDTGGKQRCFELLTGVEGLNTFALSWDNQEAQTALNGMPYRVIPAGAKAVDRAHKLFGQGFHSYDAMPTLCLDDLNVIRKAIDDYNPDLMILEHPWLVELTEGRPYVYDAHNFESFVTASLFGRNSMDYNMVTDIERWAISGAEHVTYCSKDDWRMMGDNWQPLPPGTHIPNGTHLPETVANGQNLNLIFVGSMYGPNIRAAERLIALASSLPEYHINIVGRCSEGLHSDEPNVTLHGFKSEAALEKLLQASHIFVNLVTEGSGTHLKIAKALAHGLPVVTLPAGARGYDAVLVTDLERAPDDIRNITRDWHNRHTIALEAAQQYDWANIKQQFAGVIHALQ
jgi:glycosyltransferase involved in cell wall biosynthesis